jgi:hypothetical protein
LLKLRHIVGQYISKLLHAPGVFFSPGRNQADNPREQRHRAAWAANPEKAKL